MLIKPKDGWKQCTFYLVRIAWRDTNPIHMAIFYCGFLDDNGEPGSYSCIMNPSYDCSVTRRTNERITYLEIVRELVDEKEWRDGDRFLLPKEML